MVWEIEQPEDITEIKNLGVAMRPNWKAIEEAESSLRFYAINLRDRIDPLPLDPSAISSPDAITLFCKQDDDAHQEFYLLYQNGTFIKLTEEGTVGSHSSTLRGQSLKLDTLTPSLLFNSSYMIDAHGSFDTLGAPIGTNLNITCLRNGPGDYTLSIVADVLMNDNYRVILTANKTGGDLTVGQVTSKASVVAGVPTDITIETKTLITGVFGNVLQDCSFDVMIVGGR